jgi:hypothetical protein
MTTAFRALVFLLVPLAFAQEPFRSIPPAIPDALRFSNPLPDFEAKDIAGRTWRSTDLRGKFTLIYIWGTFEARTTDKLHQQSLTTYYGFPDLPELQRFHDKVKSAGKMQVLTFCRDYDYTHASDYIKDAKYTFPVIADWVLIDKLLGKNRGGGRLWVVDPEGRLSYPLQSWTLGHLLFELERAAAQK